MRWAQSPKRLAAQRTYRHEGLRLALSLFLATTGCGPSEEAVEARRVVAAIDALRSAPNTPTGRDSLVVTLEREAAVFPRAQAAKRACIDAYRALEEATKLEARVRSTLATPDQVTPETLKDLADAEAQLKTSRDSMPRCEAALRDLRTAAKP